MLFLLDEIWENGTLAALAPRSNEGRAMAEQSTTKRYRTRTRLLKLQNHSLSNPFPTRPTGTVHIWTRNFLVSHLSACILNDLQSMHLSQTEKADGTMSLTQCPRREPNDLHWDSWVISESCKMIDFIEHVRYSHDLNSIYIRVMESGKNNVGNPMP